MPVLLFAQGMGGQEGTGTCPCFLCPAAERERLQRQSLSAAY